MAPVVDSTGFWGPITATIDWCEENYEVSPFFAEFWNSLTNLSMLLPAVWGIYDVITQKLDTRFLILYCFLFLTGVGSWMFHMTLLYEMQLLDELPMVWGTAFMIYCLYQVRTPSSNGNSGLAALILTTSVSVVITAVYLVNRNPMFFEVSYGSLVVVMLCMDLYLNTKQYSKAGMRVFLLGHFLYLIGFVFWNVDNRFCPSLRLYREQMLSESYPFLFRPLSQMHGWWHLLAGYATYIHIQSCIHHRLAFLGIPSRFRAGWWFGLRIQRTDKPKRI